MIPYEGAITDLKPVIAEEDNRLPDLETQLARPRSDVLQDKFTGLQKTVT